MESQKRFMKKYLLLKKGCVLSVETTKDIKDLLLTTVIKLGKSEDYSAKIVIAVSEDFSIAPLG